MDLERYGRDCNLRIEIDSDGVALVTLNRPDARNAIDYALHRALIEAIRELGNSRDVRAVVLTGAGKSFCAGGDVAGFFPEDVRPLDELRLRDLTWEFARCEAPLVAALNGTAVGLGATLALLCDVVYMADTARIGDAHVNVGLNAGDGAQVIWPLLIGPNRAKEYLMAGELITAQEADRVGLVNRVFPAGEVLERALEYARKLARGAPAAIRWTKLGINKVLHQHLNLSLEFGLAAEAMCGHTQDAQEAVAAFREKRAPVFRGR